MLSFVCAARPSGRNQWWTCSHARGPTDSGIARLTGRHGVLSQSTLRVCTRRISFQINLLNVSRYAFGLDSVDFAVTSALLRLSTKYGVDDLRQEVLRVLLLSWPTTLALWEVREKKVTNVHGIYAPRTGLPHPL